MLFQIIYFIKQTRFYKFVWVVQYTIFFPLNNYILKILYMMILVFCYERIKVTFTNLVHFSNYNNFPMTPSFFVKTLINNYRKIYHITSLKKLQIIKFSKIESSILFTAFFIISIMLLKSTILMLFILLKASFSSAYILSNQQLN